MSQSLSKVLVHLIFSTKSRAPMIDLEIEPRLHAYMAGILNELECPCILVGGAADHTHSLFMLSKTRALTDVVKELKQSSSKWMKEQNNSYREFYWQSGYGAFSIGESGVENLKTYIAGQREHHKKTTFQDEMRAFLRRYGVEYDERYIWD